MFNSWNKQIECTNTELIICSMFNSWNKRIGCTNTELIINLKN